MKRNEWNEASLSEVYSVTADTGINLLPVFLYIYNLMRGITCKGVPLSSYTCSAVVVPQLEIFMYFLIQNNIQCCHHIFLKVSDVLKSLLLQGVL
jgi:hypothetical protein